jgi:hypothetical protein
MKTLASRYIINLGLLLSALVVVFSGLLIQIEFHMGSHDGVVINNSVMGFGYSGWLNIHRIAIVIISLFMIFHVLLHWKWYKAVVKKRLIKKNRQVIILSIVFVLTAVTGYIPWFISLAGGEELSRKLFIEIHDKLALILFVFLILHLLKRMKWFIANFNKFIL